MRATDPRLTPAGDFDYEAGGTGYARIRRADPRIEARIHAALADAAVVLNVGAGAGSYEPADRTVLAIEPSAAMRAQRPAHLAAAIDGTAEAIPLPDDAADAAMATITIHQWPDLAAGLGELRRTVRRGGPIVLLTIDPLALGRFWLRDWVPSLLSGEAARHPSADELVGLLGPDTTITPVPIPLDCTDGFFEAYFGRPEQLLDPDVRRSQSAWAFADPTELEAGLGQLAADLADGTWDARYGHLRTQPEYDGALRLVVAHS
ncbi:MAG: methyltransferase domain-containing protein [Patulibacter minatonensis]